MIKKWLLTGFILFGILYAFSRQTVYYNNPILSGFYPDPSICRAGDDYYLVNSSFAYFPGLPVFHSKDLMNWNQIGNAMNRPEQLPLDRAGVSRGLFAPAISFHQGTFYIVCTLIDGMGNFVITAKDPAGPWSNPVVLPAVNGIDPSLFFEDSGEAWLVYNSVAPDNRPLYNGHRTIRLIRFDAAELKVKGDEKILVDGGTDITKKPVWIEGPHIYKKDDWYYLICAEGGTGYNHSEVVFKSKTVDGPYTPYENNPVLTQRHLDKARPYPVTNTGHADMVEAKDGNWYAVFLGCRPYEDDYYNIGRETFLLPVTWKDGWPHILDGNETVPYKQKVPFPSFTKKVANPFASNAFFFDDFNEPALHHRYIFLRTPAEQWYSLQERKGFLCMRLRPETCGGRGNPSFIAFRQPSHQCEAVTRLQFEPAADNEKAGLAIFQNETHYYFLCKSLEAGKPVVQLYRAAADSNMQLMASAFLPEKQNAIQLKIVMENAFLHCYYSTAHRWTLLKDSLDAKMLSTRVAGGFVGSVFALYATSMGKQSRSRVYVDRFACRGKDDMQNSRGIK